MNIGSTIKQMRKERDMTQEQLAEALEISISAISQWELGKTMPDITLLPRIAHIFGTTTDELLGVEQESIELTVRARTAQAVELGAEGDYDRMLALAKQTYREFPNTLSALAMYAWILQRTADSEHPERWNESIRMSKKILERSRDDRERIACIYRICKCYAEKGDKENALIYALQLPRSADMNAPYILCRFGLSDQGLSEDSFKQIKSLVNMLNHYGAGIADDPVLSAKQKQAHLDDLLADIGTLTETLRNYKKQTEEIK